MTSADVWVLTETHPDFCPAPGFVRQTVSADAPDRVGGGRWVAIWTRADIEATAVTVEREPERAAAVRIVRPGARQLLVFGTVLPWRGDARRAEVRGGRAFARSLELQAADWDDARAAEPGAELCITGDFNQEFGADGPVGTKLGRAALAAALGKRDLTCVTGGERDPLLTRGWRASIDHVVLSAGLRARSAAEVWPEQFPLTRALSDHHGVCVTVADA